MPQPKLQTLVLGWCLLGTSVTNARCSSDIRVFPMPRRERDELSIWSLGRSPLRLRIRLSRFLEAAWPQSGHRFQCTVSEPMLKTKLRP